MKPYLGLLGLSTKDVIYKTLGICVLMSAVQALLFLNTSAQNPTEPLEFIFKRSHAMWVAYPAVILFIRAFSPSGNGKGKNKHSKLIYTLQRLSVSDKVIVLLWAASYTAAIFIFWATEAVTLTLLARHHLQNLAPDLQGISLFYYFNSIDYLHGVLPVSSVFAALRLALTILGLGITTSCMGYQERHGRTGMAFIFVLYCALFSLADSTDSVKTNLLYCAFLAFCSGVALFNVFTRKEESIDAPQEETT